jgi:hypothetical protein
MLKNKRGLIILILLLLLALLVYFFHSKKNRQEKQIDFTLQGTTTINEGEIKLTIWDNNTEDGDSVKVYLDNKLIRDTLALLYQPLELNFGKLSKGEHTLGVVAINEGATAPASAAMSLSNGAGKNEFDMYATKDSAASWKIIIQ